jgi:hypothetical protein
VTGDVKLEFPATTINEAILLATERWRVLAEDPEAVLPWSTHFTFYEEPISTDTPGGATRSICVVVIEFDRKVIDELTGAVPSTATS